MRRWIKLFEDVIPDPSTNDLLDAIRHADVYDEGWELSDFNLKYLGYLSVDEIGEYDDLSSWPEVETIEDLQTFRQGKFKTNKFTLSPIIIITSPEEDECHTQVGDGRGRVNYAIAHNIKLHAWHLIHKDCQ